MNKIQKALTPAFLSLALAGCGEIDDKIAYCAQDQNSEMSYSIIAPGINGTQKMVIYNAPKTVFNAMNNRLEGEIVKTDIVHPEDRAELMRVDLKGMTCTVYYDNEGYASNNKHYQPLKTYTLKHGHSFGGM